MRAECNRDLYMDDIEQLPLANTPDVFGLHPNAEIGYYTTAAKGYSCYTAQKMKFSVKYFFSKCDQISSFLFL